MDKSLDDIIKARVAEASAAASRGKGRGRGDGSKVSGVNRGGGRGGGSGARGRGGSGPGRGNRAAGAGSDHGHAEALLDVPLDVAIAAHKTQKRKPEQNGASEQPVGPKNPRAPAGPAPGPDLTLDQRMNQSLDKTLATKREMFNQVRGAGMQQRRAQLAES
jgi:hypothetical protein